MKHVFKKAFLFVQTLALSVSLFSFPVYAQGNTTTYNGYDVIKGTAQFPSGDSNVTDDISTIFYYSDGYFTNPETYNSSLATMSMCMALAAMNANAGGTSDYSNKSAHIKQLLSDIGCAEEDIYINQAYKEKPTKDTIGVAIASKKLANSDSILIPIAIRGGNYEMEWVSNVTLGLEGQAEGFSTAADKVFAEVQNYIASHDLTDKVNNGKVKFWIAGYSRAGAVTNLVSKKLIDNYSNNEVYGYTFEAPQGGLSSQNDETKYASIHNIINDADLVPLVAPTLMGFGRYGTTHPIGTHASNYRESMEEQLKQINSQTFSGSVVLPEESFSLAHLNWKIVSFDSDVSMSTWLTNFMDHIQTYTMDKDQYRYEYVKGYGHGSI